jgi:hypothetical protein
LNPECPDKVFKHSSIKDNYCENFDFFVKAQGGNSGIFDGPNYGSTYRGTLSSVSDVRFQNTEFDFVPSTNGWYRLVYGWSNRGMHLSQTEGTIGVMGQELAISSSAQSALTSIRANNPLQPYGSSDDKLPVSKIRLIRSGSRCWIDIYVEQFNHWKDWIGRFTHSTIYSKSMKGAIPLCIPRPSLKISSITASSTNALVTCNSHGLFNGAQVWISDSDSTPSINGLRTISNVTENTFTISGITITSSGTFAEMFYQEQQGGTESASLTLEKDTAIALTKGNVVLGTSKIMTGAGAPSADAPNGSVYLRTDGDASTTLYVRANGVWEPLVSY